MTANTERFSDRVEAYERFRARFPTSVLDRVRAVCGLTPVHIVADVGAGTGMLAELFLRNGNSVIAVEPNREMRAACERLRERFPKLIVVDASAEQTSLDACSVDVVVVGRAFHWFDRSSAMHEFRRILKPEGWVVLVSSRWSGDGSEPSQEFEEILKDKGVDYHRVLEAQLSAEEAKELFVIADLHFEEIHGEQRLTLEELLGRTASLSVTPLPGDRRYVPFRAALEAYFGRHAEAGLIRMAVSYDLIYGRPRVPASNHEAK